MTSLFIGGPADGLRKKPVDRRVVEIAYSDELGRPVACTYYEHTYVVYGKGGNGVKRYSIMSPNVKEGDEHELVVALIKGYRSSSVTCPCCSHEFKGENHGN